ncbi:MAG: hypothetical protein H7061_12915 [Bdellovibrionaceae bacterium]|nr:hypothetical protein [Bdellovibrio sp.]
MSKCFGGQFEKSKSQNVLGKIQTFVQAKNFSAALEILDKAFKVGLIGAELTAQLKKSLELGHVTRALFNINEIKFAITSFGSFDPCSDNLFFRPGVIDFAKLGAAFETIKQLVLATIDNYTKVAGPSKEEELKCFTCDFFKV